MSRFAGRGLDQAWFLFFVMHIPISVILDAQPVYPQALLAKTPFPALLQWYLAFSRDPILGGALNGGPEWAWMRTLIRLEAFFQVPVFAIAAAGLWKNDKRIYPLMLAYGASTATATLPTLVALWTNVSTPALTTSEMTLLMSSYVPFLFIPLAIALDMGIRLGKIINTAQERKVT